MFLLWVTLRKLSESTTERCFNYDTILLKTFFEIAASNNLKLLIKDNKTVSDADLEVVWESIIKKNNKANNNFAFDNYFATAQSHTLLVNEYSLVKACILKLIVRDMQGLEFDKPVVELLRSKGYKIDISGRLVYLNSLEAAQQRSNNLLTKIITKQKELKRFSEEKAEPVTFPQALANISGGMGFMVDDKITLSMYNEFKKFIQNKNKNGGNKRPGFNRR